MPKWQPQANSPLPQGNTSIKDLSHPLGKPLLTWDPQPWMTSATCSSTSGQQSLNSPKELQKMRRQQRTSEAQSRIYPRPSTPLLERLTSHQGPRPKPNLFTWLTKLQGPGPVGNSKSSWNLLPTLNGGLFQVKKNQKLKTLLQRLAQEPAEAKPAQHPSPWPQQHAPLAKCLGELSNPLR
jgi:hypothetical protein